MVSYKDFILPRSADPVFSTSTPDTTVARRAKLTAWASVLALCLSGCATLPSNGPTVSQVTKGEQSATAAVPYRIVEIDPVNAAIPAPTDNLGLLRLAALSATDPRPARTDLIRAGDTLTISVFEVGIALFSGQSASLGVVTSRPPTASTQMVTLQVREDGTIDLPYIGRMTAANTYPEALASQIKARLRGLSEHPDVLVTLTDSLENITIVSGAVARPGRVKLTSARERLLDAVALAGGTNVAPADAEIRLIRGQKSFTARLGEVRNEDLANVSLLPGDRVEVVRAPKTYTVFGAIDKITQIPFETPQVSLAEALARATGPSDSRANPRGIYVFRWERGENGAPPTPLVYHINLLKPDSYFLAQTFQMHDKDVVLVANSNSNMTQKFVGLINQLFSPALAVRYASQ